MREWFGGQIKTMPTPLNEHGLTVAATQRGGKVNQLHLLIRNAIQDGQFAPGQRLVESDLTEEFGVSRGPLREALRLLAKEGFVDIVPNRGAVVRRLTLDEIANTMVVREALEGLAAALAAKRIGVEGHRAKLERLIAQHSLGELKPLEEFLKENKALHQVLVEFADNPRLSELIDQMHLNSFPRRVARGAGDEAYRLASTKEHLAIARAVLKGDEDKARLAMQKHLHNAQQRILRFPP